MAMGDVGKDGDADLSSGVLVVLGEYVEARPRILEGRAVYDDPLWNTDQVSREKRWSQWRANGDVGVVKGRDEYEGIQRGDVPTRKVLASWRAAQ